MRHLLSILSLFCVVQAFAQMPQDSSFLQLEDTISSLSIRPLKHSNKLLRQLIKQIELDALQQVNEDRKYQVEATYTLDKLPPFTASCILPAIIDSIPIRGFTSDSLDLFLENVSLKGPYKLTEKDSIRLKQILFDTASSFCHRDKHKKKCELEINWPYMFAPYISYRKIARFCNVTAYSIDDASGRSVFRIQLTKKDRLRPGASIGNYVLPGYKVDAYFDSRTMQMIQFKFGTRGPSLRWKTTQTLRQYDYDIKDGKPILKRYQKIGVFDGKIKERTTLCIIE